MSAISVRGDVGRPEFDRAWRNEGTGGVLSMVSLAQRGRAAYLTFDSAADARAVAAECIKAAEAMERLEAEGEASDG